MTAEPGAAPGREDTGPDIAEQVKSEQLAALYERTMMPTMLGLAFSLFPVVLLWSHLPQACCWAGWARAW